MSCEDFSRKIGKFPKIFSIRTKKIVSNEKKTWLTLIQDNHNEPQPSKTAYPRKKTPRVKKNAPKRRAAIPAWAQQAKKPRTDPTDELWTCHETRVFLYLWVELQCPTNSVERFLWRLFRTKIKENSQSLVIFHVLYKFGFSEFQIKTLCMKPTCTWVELSVKRRFGDGLTTWGIRKRTEGAGNFVFSRIISVFFTTKIRLGGKRVKNTFSSVLGRRSPKNFRLRR